VDIFWNDRAQHRLGKETAGRAVSKNINQILEEEDHAKPEAIDNNVHRAGSGGKWSGRWTGADPSVQRRRQRRRPSDFATGLERSAR
jgi:hypothetical protein